MGVKELDEKPKSKPPLGIMPRYLYLDGRRRELAKAIYRYREAGLSVSSDWYEEYFELTEQLGFEFVKETGNESN